MSTSHSRNCRTAPTRRPGDQSTLTLTNNTYQLRKSDGTIYHFNTDGTLSRIQGSTGDQTTFAYSSEGLVSMTDSVTDEMTSYAYNAAGRITQITDPEGRITTLSYNPSNTLLESDYKPRSEQQPSPTSAIPARRATTRSLRSPTMMVGVELQLRQPRTAGVRQRKRRG